jgi:hypothetical protein
MRAGDESRSAGLVDQLANPVLFGHECIRPGLEVRNAALQIPPPQPGRCLGFRTGVLERPERASQLGADGPLAGD